jgi:hypothetical protein
MSPFNLVVQYSMKRINTKNTKGYILFYVVIAGGLFFALATSVLTSTLRELEISEQELNATKARFAAESGVECITYWQTTNWPRPLDTTGPSATIHCDTQLTSQNFTSPGQDGDPECDEYTHTMSIGPFTSTNDQCADIEIRITEHPATPLVCSTQVVTHGYSDCSSNPLTQRSLWYEL